MIKSLRILFIVALATIFSCNHLEKHMAAQDDEAQTIFEGADKVSFRKSDPPLGGDYGRRYRITATATGLQLSISNQRGEELLNKRYSFTQKKFDKLLASINQLKQKDEELSNSDIPAGGTTKQLEVYKGNKQLFDGIDYGRDARTFTGGDIDISYLIEDLEELVKSTRNKDN